MKNLGDAFSYQFKDKKWIEKIVLGSVVFLLSMFIIPLPLLIGYALQNVRNVMDKKKEALPEWKDLGKMYVLGLRYLLISISYALPIFAVIALILLLVFMIILVSFIFQDYDLLALLMIPFLLIFVMYALIGCYGLLMMFMAPVLYIKMARGDSYKEMFNLKEIFKFIKDNFVNILIVLALGWAGGLITNLGAMFFFIGIFPAGFYVMTMISHLYGQLYLESEK